MNDLMYNITMNLENDEKLKSIIDKVLPILQKYHVNKASVFGSYASGKYTEGSDLDLLVETPRELSLFQFIEIEQELEKKLSLPVDLVEESTLKSVVKDQVLKDKITFYERE